MKPKKYIVHYCGDTTEVKKTIIWALNIEQVINKLLEDSKLEIIRVLEIDVKEND